MLFMKNFDRPTEKSLSSQIAFFSKGHTFFENELPYFVSFIPEFFSVDLNDLDLL